ncbi:MAG: MFS transporter [Acidobacteriota bacterium]|nr:MFS transporter [Acidobacteriota bacterium]
MRLDHRGARRALVSLLVLLSVTSYFQRTSISIAGPAIAREFGLTPTQLGTVYSAFLLGYALFMIPGGALADRFGPRKVLGLVAAITAVFTTLTAMAGAKLLGGVGAALVSLIVIRFALGVGSAPLYPGAARVNANWMPPAQRGIVQGWIAAGAGLGGAISPFVFPFVIARWGWRAAFAGTGMVTLLFAILWFSVARDYPRGATAERKPAIEWRQLLANRNLWLITLGYVATCYFEYIFFYWTYYYLGEVRHAGESQSALFTTILFLSWTIFAPVGGRVTDALIDRWGPRAGLRAVPIAASLLGAIVTVLAMRIDSIAGTGLLMALALGLGAAMDAAYWSSAIGVGGAQSGAAGAIMNTGGNIGGFIAPVLTPWIAAQFGWPAGLYLGCVIVVAGAALWLVIDPAPRSGDQVAVTE